MTKEFMDAFMELDADKRAEVVEILGDMAFHAARLSRNARLLQAQIEFMEVYEDGMD